MRPSVPFVVFSSVSDFIPPALNELRENVFSVGETPYVAISPEFDYHDGLGPVPS